MNEEVLAEVLAEEPGISPIGVGVAVMTTIAVVTALYLGRAFFVPLLIGILASYALHPLVDWLETWRVPHGAGAALVLALVVGSFSWVGYEIGDDTAAMIEKLPEAARKLRRELGAARSGAPSALQNVQEATSEIEAAAADAGGKSGARAKPGLRVVEPPAPGATWLRDYTFAQTALLASVAAQAPIVLLLTYFLLASGLHFRRKLVQLVGPSLTRKKEAVRILEEIDVQVQRYLLVMLLTNVLLALACWAALAVVGMTRPALWATVVGVLHFIPYVGGVLGGVAVGVAAFIESGSLSTALYAFGATMVLVLAMGMGFNTWLQGRACKMNPVAVFVSVLLFGWLWGGWGLLLGAPLAAVFKTIADRVEGLQPFGELMGEVPRAETPPPKEASEEQSHA